MYHLLTYASHGMASLCVLLKINKLLKMSSASNFMWRFGGEHCNTANGSIVDYYSVINMIDVISYKRPFIS